MGSLNTAFEKRVISDIENVCRKYDSLVFKFEGFRQFGNFLRRNRVLAVNIEPSTELAMLRSDMIKALSEYCKLGKFDKKEWKPHATLAFKDIDSKFSKSRAFWINKIALP